MATPEVLPTVFIVQEQSSGKILLSVVRKIAGAVIVIAVPEGFKHLSDEDLVTFFREARALHSDRSLTVATKDARAAKLAATEGWTVIRTLKDLRIALAGSPHEAGGIRAFSPVSWRQDIRSRLQSAGLLTLPKVRIWTLFVISILAFIFVFLRLLPSAQIRIWPNQETANFTTNVYLMSSGAVLPVPLDRVHVLPLELLTVHISRSMTYDQVSKKFTGTNAQMYVTVINDADEPYSLRQGTRLINQAGMRFRLQQDVLLPAHSKKEVLSVADPLDQYGEVLGERGNVPIGVKWDFIGLPEADRKYVYARNDRAGFGGKTSYVNILTREDIEGAPRFPGARQRLEQELLMVVRQQVEEDRTSRNFLKNTHFFQLQYEELTKTVFSNFDLGESFIGQNVSSIPIEGEIDYTVILYDEQVLLDMLKSEVALRVPANKMIVPASLVKENIGLHVIPPWNDDLLWVKLTVDLTYSHRYIISPVTPSGAKFGKYIRDNTAGKSVAETYRIIKNLPEVSRVEVTLWPPWAMTVPSIEDSISITEMEN
ncbi:MAG: hypothetical protein PHZ00_03075 [Candidatus Peribacteraceae bacterium]|nr:hypothetical protein [Candidatus Peribacteraceae bacterium]